MDGHCSKEELTELYAAVSSSEHETVADLLDEEFGRTHVSPDVQDVDWDHMFNRIMKKKPARQVHIRRYAAAAAVILLLVIAGGFYHHTHKSSTVPQDILPGNNKAMLTLADGSTVTLDSAGNRLIQQGKTAIQQQGGKLQYNAQNNDGTISYNTLSTPRGGQFRITLPDGTEVWLNAASSLRYPVAFTGKQREVTLTGEAYFEVVHNENMPFSVHAGGMDIKDVGTHFNVMAYNDEVAVKTTLIEGAVNISDGKKNFLLKPGQQAVDMAIQEADVDEAIAWKNGEFSFHHTSIYEVMRQLSRWYNVDVNYKDSLNIYLSGNITKNVTVSEVFKMLELAGDVTFKIENKKATVMKQ
jgi:ferric-dicitrate binding protein FerR (iron transport regulator)